MNAISSRANSDAAAALLEGLLPEQRRIVTTLDRPVFVAAGAGSGKTFTLTRRIVWALCPGSGGDGEAYLDSLDQALIITFTEKAAGEIKERIRSALRDAGLADEARKVDSAWVSTIHHMCARILRAHALDLGLDPQFGMVDEHESQVMKSQALEDALAQLEGDEGLDALFAEYGVEAGRSGGDGVAGLIAKVRDTAASAERGLDSLTFISADADVSGSLRSLANAYEELCACETKYEDELERCRASRDMLRDFFLRAPGERTADAANALLAQLYRPNGRLWRARAVQEFCKAVQTQLATARAELTLARTQQLEGPLLKLARHVDELYSSAKRARRVLDNDDLLQLVARAFREHPEIAAQYSSKFRLVMVDEFQDTNGQQVSMVKGLSGADACHLTTVGDVQQAIYGFRGADVGVFEERRAEVDAHDTIELAYNFRSDDAILRFVARVCGTTGIVSSFMDLKAKPNRTSSFPEQNHPRVAVELTRAHKLGRKSVPSARRTQIAAAQLADRLARIRDAGVAPRQMAVLMRSLRDADIYIEALRERGLESVVVGGSTFSQAPEVQCMLALVRTLANPRDTTSGLFPLLESDMFALDANDMLVLATKLQDAYEAPSKRRIYPGIRLDALDFPDVAVSERLGAARRVLARAWSRLGTLPVADICLMTVRESGWFSRLENEGVAGRAVSANILSAIRHIRELAQPEGFNAIRTADEFARWLDAAKEGPASLSGEGLDAVSLMTAHASKGLEFDVVAVVGCCGSESTHTVPRLLSRREGDKIALSLAPKSFSCPDLGEDTPVEPSECVTPLEWRSLLETTRREEDAREDGRLLYVALTRAKECVILALNATQRSKGGLSPAMTDTVAAGLFGAAPSAGNSAFSYGGAADGLVRCVDLELMDDGSVVVDSGQTLGDCAAVRACAHADLLAERIEHGDTSTGVPPSTPHLEAFTAITPEALQTTFDLPADNFEAHMHAALTTWRPREGVFSYSSAVRETSAPLEDLCIPVPDTCDQVELVTPSELDMTSPTNLRAALCAADRDDETSSAEDADRATQLGSAFHELARFLVETGHMPSEERIGLVADAYGITRRARSRLTDALGRWESSEIRQEVLDYPLVRAEVPFFCEVDSPFGRNLEGAFDLIATGTHHTQSTHPVQDTRSMQGTRIEHTASVLLVDYKTGDHGLSYAQIRVRHELQARLYATVLKRMGYATITCAFVCVELEDTKGQPVVVRYQFA